jgi:hypothetical protein
MHSRLSESEITDNGPGSIFKVKLVRPFVRFARASVDISVAPQCE